MQKFALSLVAAVTALAALSLWSLAWLQWHDHSLVGQWIQPSSEGTLWIQTLVGFALLGFAKECSNRAKTSVGQVLFIVVTGIWGIAALCAGMNLLPITWLPNAPTSNQAVLIFLAGCISLTQAARATRTLSGEADEGEEEESPSSDPSSPTSHKA